VDVLSLWQRVAAEDGAARWAADDVFGFFQRFRPSGSGVAEAILPLPRGEEVLARLRRLYQATADGPGRDAYFVVRSPLAASRTELEQLARAQIASWAQMARDLGDDELAKELAVKSVEFQALPTPKPEPPVDAPEAGVFDAESDWHAALSPIYPDAGLVREAFYSVACDFRIARHLTWPWYEAASSLPEPFEPYFELWVRGAWISVPEAGRVLVGRGPQHLREDA
jgi:hypothetical protein